MENNYYDGGGSYFESAQKMMTSRVGKLGFNQSDILGRGSSGTTVYSGFYWRSDSSSLKVAIKRVLKTTLQDQYVIKKEAKLMEKASHHPNILRIIRTEMDNDFLYIATELCRGTLEEYVKGNYNGPKFENETEILRQVTRGLSHLHEKKIVHRDIKPSNILVFVSKRKVKPVIKLAYFGISKILREDKLDVTNTSLTNPNGTRGWMPPEVYQFERVDFSVDVWALGCIFAYTLSAGKHPFGDDPDERTHLIKNKEPIILKQENLKEPYSKDPFTFDLIKSMLETDPSKRPTVTDVEKSFLLNHPALWLSRICESFKDDLNPLQESEGDVTKTSHQDDCIRNQCEENEEPLNEDLQCCNYVGNVDISGHYWTLSRKLKNAMIIVIIGLFFIPSQHIIKPEINRVRTKELLELSSNTSRMFYEDVVHFYKIVQDISVDVNATDPINGMNALLKLSRYYGYENLVELVQPLIDFGIDVNATDEEGWNALHNLCRYYKHDDLIDMIRLLHKSKIEFGVKTKVGSIQFYLEAFANNPAMQQNIDEIVEILPKEGDFLKIIGKIWTKELLKLSNYTTPLPAQELSRFFKILWDDNIDVNARDPKDGLNALLKLTRYYNQENPVQMVQHLIKKGISINATDHMGRNALHLVFQKDTHYHLDQVADSLIYKGIDVNAQTKTGWSPLHVLFRYYRRYNLIYLTKDLIKSGAHLNAKTLRGWTPLHFLCRYYNDEKLLPVIKLLIANKVNLAERTAEGHSASYLLKTVFWNPPKNRDQILSILPDDDKNEPKLDTTLKWLMGSIDDSL